MIDRSLAIISEFTGADMAAFFSLTGPIEGHLNVVGHLWVPDDLIELMDEQLPQRPETHLFKGTEVEVLADLDMISPVFRTHLEKIGIECILSVPVTLRGEVMGYVIGGLKGSLKLDDESLAILRAVGDQLGVVFETAKLMLDKEPS